MNNIRAKSETLSDWRSDLGENAAIKMPTVRPGQFTSTGGSGKAVPLPEIEDEKLKSTGGKGKVVPLPKVKPGQFKEEIQGGVSVEPYTKDTKFLEIETVDIIKAKPLNELNIKYIGPGKGRKAKDEDMTKHKGEKTGPNYLIPQASINNKEVVSASYEADLENMVLQILEEDITDLYNEGFSYDEVVEFYGVEEDLTEAWGLLAKGAFQGAKMLATKVAPKVIKYVAKRGAKDIKTVAKFARNPKNWARANKDIDKVGKFAKELPARVYQSGKALRGATNKGLLNPTKDIVGNIKAAKRGGDLAVIRQQIKGNIATNNPRVQAAANKFSNKTTKTTKTTKSNFTKSKVKPELNRVPVTPTQARVAVQPSKSTVPNITGSQARAAVEAGGQKAAKAVLKPKPVHVPRQKITQRGSELLSKLQGKDKKQLKAKELLARMDKAISRSKKPGTMSDKTDKIISQIRNDKGSALVKSKSNKITTTSSTAITRSKPSGSTAITRSKPSGSTAITRSKPSGSGAIKEKPASKSTAIKEKPASKSTAIKEKPASKSTVDVKATEVGKGSKATQKKIKMAREWQALNKAAGATLKADKAKSISNAAGVGFYGLVGLEAGLNVGKKLGKKKAKSSAPDSPKDEPKGVIPNEKKKEEKKSENKTISNTEKKTVDPKKNPKLTPIQKFEKKRQEKLKYGTSGSHLTPLEQEMAN